MLRLGITSAERYHPTRGGALRRLWQRTVQRRLSMQLLRTSIPATPEELAVFEAVMLQMRLGSGIYRTTFRGRFHEVDAVVNESLQRHFRADAPLDVQDLAASDCVTSSEWAETLLPLFPAATLHASDLTLFLVEALLDDGTLYILESDGHALQCIQSSLVIQLDPMESYRFPVNRLLARRALARLASLRLQMPGSWLSSSDESLALPGVLLRKLPVIHPFARALADANPRFTIGRHDAFQALQRPCDVIRAMNIFHKVYFDDDRLARAALSVWRSLRPGGLWIVGRTIEYGALRQSVSILERGESAFRLIDRIGDGSDMEDIALAVRDE
jgi:hypothetical protein